MITDVEEVDPTLALALSSFEQLLSEYLNAFAFMSAHYPRVPEEVAECERLWEKIVSSHWTALCGGAS